MKKLFTLMFAFVAFTLCAQAQISDDFESYTAFTVDPTGTWTYYDGDGLTAYTLNGVSFTNALYTGSCIVFNPSQTSPATDANYAAHSGSQFLAIFNGIPDDSTGVSATNDWIISPALSLTGSAILSFYAREIVDTYGPEVMKIWYSTTTNTPSAFTLLQTENVSTTTWTNYTYTIPANATYFAISCNSDDVFALFIDDISLMAIPTTPTIVASAANIDFGTVLVNGNATEQATVTAYSLTTGITATTAAPFSVSADGTTYGTTATIAQAGGDLYVKYAPTASGTDNGTVTLSSTGATDVTISLTGNGLDCSNTTIPYSCDFTNDAQNNCWTIVDANNDASTFSFYNGAARYHWDSSNDANDYLISPAFNFTGTQSVTYDVMNSSYFTEIYEVLAFGSDTVVLRPADTINYGSYVTETLNVSSLSGDYSIAFHCISEADQFYLYITNFNVIDASSAIVNVDETSFDFGTIPAGSTASDNFNINSTNLNETIAVSTSAPFEVSLDGTTYSTSVTVPADTNFIATAPVYVRFAPTAAGTFTDEVVITTTTTADTIAVTGTAISCEAITTFPFTETFDPASTTLACWQVVDANNDGNTIDFMAYDDANPGVAVYFYGENAAEDWLISPEITLPAGGAYLAYDYEIASATFPEKYSVWVIPQNATYATATNILPTQTITATGLNNNMLDLSSYANQTVRIAFKVESDADMYYIYFDNVTVNTVGEASITVNPTSMSFSGIANNPTTAQTASVVGMGLTNDITVTATAPFEVSTDGNSFAATATINQASIINTNIFVRMNATTAGSQTGTVTLTSGTTTATIALTGNALDCSGVQSLPYTEDFESGLNPCWINLDNDGDGIVWEHSSNPASYYPAGINLSEAGHNNTPGFAISGSFSNVTQSALTPDNWLITPAIAIPAEGATMTWWVGGQDASYYAEHYEVKVSTTGTNPSDFTSIFDQTLASEQWAQASVALNYPGQNIHIAFVHNNSVDVFLLKLDDISITAGSNDGVAEFNDNVTIYPNPANNVLNVNAASNINKVEVFNMMGQSVAVIDANSTNVTINTTAFSNGMYMMKITTENGVTNQKFTVAR